MTASHAVTTITGSCDYVFRAGTGQTDWKLAGFPIQESRVLRPCPVSAAGAASLAVEVKLET